MITFFKSRIFVYVPSCRQLKVKIDIRDKIEAYNNMKLFDPALTLRNSDNK